MATDPTKPVAPLGMDWLVPPAQPLAYSPPAPAVPEPPPGASDLRTAGLELVAGRRQAGLDDASSRRKALLAGDPDALAREAMALTNGNPTTNLDGLSVEEQMEVKSRMGQTMWDQQLLETKDRTTGEVVSDTAISVGKGIGQGLGSLGTLAAAVVDPEAGIAVAESNRRFGEWADEFKSDTITDRRDLVGLRNQLDAEESAAQYDRDIGTGDSELVAGLKQVGRDFLNSGSNYLEDGGLVGEMTTEGVGSLAGSAGIGGLAAKLVGKGLTKIASKELADRAIMGGVIGTMEGGDAYGNAALQVMDMDEKTLREKSTEYVSLREQGMSHDEAQIELAHNAGMGAAALAVPAGALGGAVVGRFERFPLGMKGAGIGDAVKTTASQFVEESYQEGVSSLAANVGLRWSGADPDKDLTEGVGESAAMGGIGGAGMGALISGPKGALRAPLNVAKMIGDLGSRREAAEVEKVSPVSDTNVREAMVQATEAETRIKSVLETPPAPEAAPDPVKERTSNELRGLLNIPDAEIQTLRPGIQETIRGKSRTDALFSLVQELDGDRLNQEEKDQSLLYIKAILPSIGALIGGDLRDRVAEMSPGMETDIDMMAETIMKMVGNPKVAKALGMEITPEQVDRLTSVENQNEAMENTAMLAEVSPTALPVSKAREALNHSKNGTLNIRPEAIRFLAMAADLGDLIGEFKGKLDTTFGSVSTDDTNRVRSEALITGRKAGKNLSMVQHIDRVSNDIRSGQMDQAQVSMEEFKLFVEGQQNKLKAMEQSKANNNGNAVKYARNTPMGWAEADAQGSGAMTYLLGKGAPKSETLLQNMRAETRAMERAYARVTKAFPEIKAPPIEIQAAIQEQAEIDQAETAKVKAEKKYRPRKGTVLPSAVGSLLEQNVSEEAAQALATIIDVNMDDRGRIARKHFDSAQLKILRDNYGVKTHFQSFKVPDSLAEETLAVRAELEKEIDDVADVVQADSLGRSNGTDDAGNDQQGSVESNTPVAEEVSTVKGNDDSTPGDGSVDAASVSDAVSPVEPTADLKVLLKDDGTEAVFYHGTKAEFDEFAPGMTFWSSNKNVAFEYGKGKRTDEGQYRTIEAKIQARNPAYIDVGDISVMDIPAYSNQNAIQRQALIDAGHDVIVYFNDDGQALIVTNTNEQVIQKKDVPETAEVVSEKAPPITLDDIVPNTTEKFRKAYSLRKNGSALLQTPAPISVIRDQIMTDERGGVLKAIWKALLGDAVDIGTAMNKRLETTEDGQNLPKRYAAGEVNAQGNTPYDFAAGRVLNLLDQKTGKYDKQIMEVAGLAFVHWLLNERKPDRNRIEDTDVASIFRTTPDLVTPQMMDVVASGTYIEAGVASLADTIMRFAGLDPVMDETRSNAGGIILGLATEMMATATKAGYFKINDKKVAVLKPASKEHPDGHTEVWDYRSIIIDNEKILEVQKTITKSGDLSLLESLIVPDADKVVYIGEPLKKIDPTQMKNRETELTAREKKAIKNEQEKPSFVNSPYLAFRNAVGREAWLRMTGYQTVSYNIKMNKKHRESVEGKNLSLADGWDKIEGHVAEVDRFAAANGLAQDDVPSFWAYGISKVGRLQQRGFGGQGDKQAREVLSPTVSILDLNDKDQDDKFWMTVAQSIGFKTEKLPRSEAVAKAKAFMEQDHIQQLLGEISIILDKTSTNRIGSVEAFAAGMQTAFKSDVSEKAAHAMFAVYQYMTTEDRFKFKHYLALESDGKTDGPINAIMNFLSGSFSVAQIGLMAMGGFFLNQKGKTLNSFFGAGGKDLYEHTVELFNNRLVALQGSLDPKASQMMSAALGLMTITGNMNYSDGKITIGRGMVKNPLTVSVYGAGIAGIAGKITRELMDSFYEKLTQSLSGKIDMNTEIAQLKMLVNNRVIMKKDGSFFYEPARHNSLIKSVDAENFVLNADQYRQLRDNIKLIFADPMVGSINDMMGDTKKTMALMQKSTQVQAIIAQEEFRKRVAVLKAGKPAGQDLSEKEYWQVFKEIAPYGAQIYMPDQSANMSVSEKLGAYNPDPSKRNTAMTKSLDDKVSGNLKTLQPSEAGVKASPFMVIMTGDAQMVLRLASNGLEKTLMVFDGVEMAADLMDQQSLEINKQVALGWETNMFSAVSDSFDNFIRQNPTKDFDAMSEESKNSLRRIFGMKRVDDLTGDRVRLEMGAISDELRMTSASIEARKFALGSVGYSVDHMASAEQPYSNDKPLFLDEKGLPLEGAPLIQKINEIYESKLSELLNQKSETKNDGLVSLVQAGAAAVRGTKEGGAVSLSANQMFSAVKTAKNSHQRAMLHAALTALKGSGYTFHMGTREELLKLRETLSPGIEQPLDLGQTDPAGKHVYIASATTETALHEALHAATIDKVFNALVEPETTTVAVKEAVDRLGLLMDEFMGYDFTQLATDTAGRNAQEAIQAHLNKGTDAGRAYAINEFMAWTMSNQDLIKTLISTKVRNPLARLVLKVLRTIKGLLRLNAIPDNMFENIRFNTHMILRDEGSMVADVQEALNHSVNADPQLGVIMKRFNDMFNHHIRNMGVNSPKQIQNSMRADAKARIEIKVNEIADIYQSAGFNFSIQQQAAFNAIQRTMMTAMELHSPSLIRTQSMFRHMLNTLKPEDFMENPQSTNPNDLKMAQDKFNAVTGAYGFRRDVMGRTSLLGSFLALSQVDPQFREMLRKIKPPKGDGASKDATSKFDEMLTQGFNTASEWVSSMMYDGPNRKGSVGQTLDNLAMYLSEVEKDSRTKLEKVYDRGFNTAENRITETIQMGVDKGIEGLAKIRQKSNKRIVKSLTGAAEAIMALGSNKYSQAYGDSITRIFNNEGTWTPIRDLFAEFRGTHSDNENLHNLVGKVKYEVSATRQDYLEVVPHTILNQFKKKMSQKEWGALSRAIASTDIANLTGRMSLDRLQEVLKDGRKLNGEISQKKAALAQVGGRYAAAYETKAEALATYMVTGEITSKNLLTNAVSISRLLGERYQPSQVPDQETIDLIDDLVSLLAIQKTNKADRDIFSDKLETEREGMNFMLAYMHDLDKQERKKTTNKRAIFNHIKGRVDTVRSGSDHIIVGDDTDFVELTRMGYKRLGDYKGDDNYKALRGYYFSPVNGQSTYHQGVMQTVQQTVYGVDGMTGYMVGNNAGRISGPAAKAIASKLVNQKKDNLKPGEYLKPVYNDDGKMVAFERMMSPEMLAKVKEDDHLATRIGNWKGRQAEEKLSKEYNRGLVSVIADYWFTQRNDRENEFVNLGDASIRDRVSDHIWNVIPKEMKSEFGDIFGYDDEGNPKLMVRRDMVNDALGYPGASVGDFFTGKNRIPQGVNEAIRKTIVAVMGTKGYTWLIQSERLWQSAVSAAKTTIVIRSVVVPFSNIISNVFQLVMRRVPIRYFGKPMARKVQETTTFLRNKVRLAELEAEGIAAFGDTQRQQALRAKYRSIEDENKRLSIWPLIERGEFATISDGLSEADKVVDNSKIMDMIEGVVNKLPEGVKTVGKYAIISRDTALFKLLNRSVQYGDFIAKSLLYDHKIEQGLSAEDAYKAIRNEFVNYNLLPGRLRTSLESLGILWFWNFKIRSVKTALDIIRNNPLSALIWSLSPVRDLPISGISDSVLSDNIIGKAVEDKLHHSMGPGMVSMIYDANPYIRFMGS